MSGPIIRQSTLGDLDECPERGREWPTLRDRIAEVLSNHFDPEPLAGQEFASAADAVLDALGLEYVTKLRQRHERGQISAMQPSEMWMDGFAVYRLRRLENGSSDE